MSTNVIMLDEELSATQRHLDMSGVPMPNFMNIGSSLRRELNEEEEADHQITGNHNTYNALAYHIDTTDLIIEEESDSEEELTEEEGNNK